MEQQQGAEPQFLMTERKSSKLRKESGSFEKALFLFQRKGKVCFDGREATNSDKSALHSRNVCGAIGIQDQKGNTGFYYPENPDNISNPCEAFSRLLKRKGYIAETQLCEARAHTQQNS